MACPPPAEIIEILTDAGTDWHTRNYRPSRAAPGSRMLHAKGSGDIVGLYINPPDHALVFGVDERGQTQALDRTQPLLPMQPGQLERGTHDYKRNRTTSLFAALELKTGRVIGQLRRASSRRGVPRISGCD